MARATKLACLLAAMLVPAHAEAMNRSGSCTIAAGDKLPAVVGGTDAVCSEIHRAIAAVAPNVSYTADITVLSPSRLSATLVVNGRSLPAQKFAIMDRELSRSAIARFAHSLAAEVAKAAKS